MGLSKTNITSNIQLCVFLFIDYLNLIVFPMLDTDCRILYMSRVMAKEEKGLGLDTIATNTLRRSIESFIDIETFVTRSIV